MDKPLPLTGKHHLANSTGVGIEREKGVAVGRDLTPHTALIPSRKNEIGKSIAGFVEEYFLNEQSLIATLRAKDRARQLGLWLSSYETSKLLATSIAQNLQTLAARGVHLDLGNLCISF